MLKPFSGPRRTQFFNKLNAWNKKNRKYAEFFKSEEMPHHLAENAMFDQLSKST